MTGPLAFKCCYSDWKLIKTRGVVQVVMEVPLADADAAYKVLGGMPDFSREVWFAIAPLKADAAEPAIPSDTRKWPAMQPAQQAGIRSNDAVFAAFLKENRPDDWHESQDAAACIRLICGVNSRAELGTNQKARVLWHQLDKHFQAWKLVDA